ncbi:MAG: ATP-binding protein [Mariprofundaceae bacterium]|nr:ATP-binding protein [Mariprofundaceae bacterium]
MLLAFGAKNFYSFKEGVEISLEVDGNCPSHISANNPATKLLCIKGANASGKTNIITILSFLRSFCCNSWDEKPEKKISFSSFFSNKETTALFCKFQTDQGFTFHYETTLTEDSILTENLYKIENNKEKLLLERKGNEITNLHSSFKEFQNTKLRSNASIISTGHQYEIKAIEPFYQFLNFIASNTEQFGRIEIGNNIEALNKYYHENKDILDQTQNFLQKVDTGIKKTEIKTRENEDGTTNYVTVFHHDTESDVEHPLLSFHDQSSGTQVLYRTLPFYFLILKWGGVLALDEFEKDLHPDVLPKIIELFESEDTNPNNAQLIFSTHDSQTMDIMGKYRTFIVNKEKSESFGYRLDEIGGELLRNDRPISPIYGKGKLGGVPKTT